VTVPVTKPFGSPRLKGVRSFAGWLAAGVCLSVALVSWFGYRAIRNAQHSSTLLLARRSSDAADLLVMALSRDMRGVEDSVLLSSRWNDAMLDPPYDIGTVVASAFARYPYPESFFGWRGSLDSGAVVFFDRADRPPAWSDPGAAGGDGRFPVTVRKYPSIGAQVARRILEDRVQGGEFSVFEIELHGVQYQFVTRLIYRDAFREQLEAGLGFTVNLPWTRHSYFPELVKQVGGIGGTREGLSLSIVDAAGAAITDPVGAASAGPVSRRAFPLLFFDPNMVALYRPADLPRREWAVEVKPAGSDPGLGSTGVEAVWTLVVAATAAGVLTLGLVLSSRAVRASARLAEMRSEFVSTVTHELKTPLATIRAVGDAVASGRVTSGETLRDYAQLVVQESKRLARLFDNLLAYSRITDVTEAYHFESLEVNGLIDEALRGFSAQLASNDFQVDVEIPGDIAAVRADRTAMGLLLDNLIDNAVRYSDTSHCLSIHAAQSNGVVKVAISDRGMGIPADELRHVVRKFFRGRRAGSGGSGLGLAIASRIVEDHGGRLDIDSAVGVGTTVHLTLPVARPDDEDAHSRR
jgi:signal transduction histidine kinase